MSRKKGKSTKIDDLPELDRKQLNAQNAESESDDDSSGGGGTGGRRFPDDNREKSSFLDDETEYMDRERRLLEQQGHRKLARVHAREHQERLQQQQAPEGDLQNDIMQNPWLDSQRFDGIDPNLNPEPPLNSEARREFDNERREQEMEKQLRLGLAPGMSTAPKPEGP